MVLGTLRSIVKNIQDNREHKRELQEEDQRKEVIAKALKNEKFIDFLTENSADFSPDDVFTLEYDREKQKHLVSSYEAFQKIEPLNDSLETTYQQALTRETRGFANEEGAKLTPAFKKFLSKEIRREAWSNPEHILEIEKTLSEHKKLLEQVQELEKRLLQSNPMSSTETRNLQRKMEEAREKGFDMTLFNKEISDLTLAQRKLIEPIKKHFEKKSITSPHEMVKQLKKEAKQLSWEAASKSQGEAQIQELRKQLNSLSTFLFLNGDMYAKFEGMIVDQYEQRLIELEEAAGKGDLESATQGLAILESLEKDDSPSAALMKSEQVSQITQDKNRFQTLAAQNFRKAIKKKVIGLKNQTPEQIGAELRPLLMKEKVGNLQGPALETLIQESLKDAYKSVTSKPKKYRLAIFLYQNGIKI